MSLVEHPSDELLIERYDQIEQTAIEGIRAGKLVGNPLLNNSVRGLNEWSISTHGLINGSTAGEFLGAVRELITDSANLNWIPAPSQHISLTEILNYPIRHKAAGISFQTLTNYHNALFENFPKTFKPMRLRLHRVFPTLDPEKSELEGRTGAIVAGFLTDGDDSIFRVKEELVEAVKKAGLPFSARYGGPPKVLFVVLGRFVEPPLQIGGKIPLLEILDELNGETLDLFTDIKDIKVICTSNLDYASPRGHVEIWPPIALKKKDQIQSSVKLLRPSQRLWYHRLQRKSMEE